MREVTGNLWDYHAQGHWVVITTNGSVRQDGRLVMGRGVAQEAAQRYPDLQAFLGKVILRSGNHVWPLARWRVFSFPVKHRWQETADLLLIEWSAEELVGKVNTMERQHLVPPGALDEIALVRPGCGNGGLRWAVVKPVLTRFLDDRFVVVEREG